MFTGIIEEVGKIGTIKRGGKDVELTIKANKVLQLVKIGDSIAVNGVCLTVTYFNSVEFKAFISNETYSITSFNDLKNGDYVNLERALCMEDRLGGHIVSGHVDGLGKLTNVKKEGNGYLLTFTSSKEIIEKCVQKGSITIDGISLTIFNVTSNSFNVACIPHTYLNTILRYKKVGDTVNLENDIIGKYVENTVLHKNKSDICEKSKLEKKKSNISMEFLMENGFL